MTSQDTKTPRYHSKGGYLHAFAAHHVRQWAIARGHSVDLEFLLSNGKSVDLILRRDADVMFVEIGISEPLSKEITNIVKDSESDIQPTAIWILVKDSKARSKMLEFLEEATLTQTLQFPIEVRLIGQFVAGDSQTKER